MVDLLKWTTSYDHLSLPFSFINEAITSFYLVLGIKIQMIKLIFKEEYKKQENREFENLDKQICWRDLSESLTTTGR